MNRKDGMVVRLAILGYLGAIAASADTTSVLASRGYPVLPEPQRVELAGGDVEFGPSWSLEGAAGDVAAEVLREDIASRFGLAEVPRGTVTVQLEIRDDSVHPGHFSDRDAAAIARQAYRLEVRPGRVVVTANAPEGLFYGVQTLVQLLRPRRGSLWLPQGVITDWPDLHARHIYWDDAHHLDRLPELKRAVRQAAFYKINGFAIKLEGHFQFRSAPAVAEPYAMTPAAFQELTGYGRRYHVEVIPYLDAPAHVAFILKHPEYAKFREFPDSNYELCATNPDAVRFINGMFRDLLDANRGSTHVYLSTDEPYYIGLADNPQCREKGSPGKLLSEFIANVANPLRDAGRTVIFWGEYPLKKEDIDSLPPYLVNGELYGPEFDALYARRGIRQMIYTPTQGGEMRFFPDYFTLSNARRVHPVPSQVDRLRDAFRTISYHPSRSIAELRGVVVAAWADMGLHTETFWLGYATISAAGWKPGTPSMDELASAFYRQFYGASVRMDRLYQLMSRQAHFWLDSWEWGPSSRKPLFGDSNGRYDPRKPVKDQTLPLPPPPGANLETGDAWMKQNARRLELAAEFLSDNDELLGLLQENLRTVQFNRYNLEVYLAVARLFRQNLEMLLDIGRMNSQLDRAARSAARNQTADAVQALDRALELARQIRQQRNTAYRDAVATYEKSWFPRVAEANGRKFLHELDDVKDHVPGRTVDLGYMIARELDLPFGAWVESIRAARNRYAGSNGRPADAQVFDWKDLGDHPVVGGIPEE